VDVNPVTDLYRVPQMQIADDDEMFGPLKAKCLALLPEAVVVPARSYHSSDDDDDDYYDNYHGEEDEEDEEEYEEEDRG